MNDEDLCYLSATEAIRLFRSGQLSPVDVMKAVIARAEAVEPTVNAFTDTFYEDALKQAAKAEKRYAKKTKRLRPLEGLPLAIKDEVPVEGCRATSGSLVYKDTIATETATFAKRLLKAGAICHARTTTPEFSCAAVTHSRLHGVTRNPWNPYYTPGGSSGGSAASLASGTSLLATGSDIAGSIRIPASCSGVVGFKPPYGRVPEMKIFNLDFYCHEGPLGRSVEDVALMENVIAGPDPHDIASLKPKVEVKGKARSIEGWKIAYSLDLGYFKVDKDVRDNTLAALKTFESLGCIVEEVDLGWTEESAAAAWNYLSHLFGASMAEVYRKNRKDLTDYAAAFIEAGIKSKAEDFVDSLRVAGEMYETFGPMMRNYHVFVCPTLAKPAIRANDPLDYGDFKSKGKVIPDALAWCMTYPFNMLSRCPVMSVPSGHVRNGVPTGIQIVGRTYEDQKVFRAAAAFEAARPWAYTPDHRPTFKRPAPGSAGG
ncbi:MAG: amidase [Rhodospirillales bacterium]